MPSIKRFYVMSNGNNYAKSKNSERTETRADTLEEVLSRPGTREALKVIHGWREQDGVFVPPRSISTKG